MRKNELIGFKIVGHNKTEYKEIRYLGDSDDMSAFFITFKDDSIKIFMAPASPVFSDTLDYLLENL